MKWELNINFKFNNYLFLQFHIVIYTLKEKLYYVSDLQLDLNIICKYIFMRENQIQDVVMTAWHK